MEAQTVSPTVPSGPEWSSMQAHIRTYLAGHPLLRGFGYALSADPGGITAELRYPQRTLRARHQRREWWKPSTPEHGRRIAEDLARELYAGWMDQLRRRGE